MGSARADRVAGARWNGGASSTSSRSSRCHSRLSRSSLRRGLTAAARQPPPGAPTEACRAPARAGTYLGRSVVGPRSSRLGWSASWCQTTQICFMRPRDVAAGLARGRGSADVQFGVWTDGVITVDRCAGGSARGPRGLVAQAGRDRSPSPRDEAPGFTFVHAGVVDAGGCGIVIPGRSYTGKSTLVAELVRLGATYVSDEYAVLDPSGLVHPFAKPLSIRTGRHDPLGQLVPVPQALVADDPVRAGLIVLTSYSPGAQWRPSVHSRAEGAFALL